MKYVISFCFFVISLQILAQKLSDYGFNHIYKDDTVIVSHFIYDYFRQEIDYEVFFTGAGILMSADSLTFTGNNTYTIIVENPKNGFMEIYFKNQMLYRYSLIDFEISGAGYCFFPFENTIALQGQFKGGKLHGLVFVQSSNGMIIEGMKFRNGKYIKHIYHWLSFSKKSLRHRSKNRSKNPLRMDEQIVR